MRWPFILRSTHERLLQQATLQKELEFQQQYLTQLKEMRYALEHINTQINELLEHIDLLKYLSEIAEEHVGVLQEKNNLLEEILWSKEAGTSREGLK